MKIEEGYTPLDKYTKYSEYDDSKVYEIGDDRSVPTIDQITMKGDTNSQYITFQIPRYWDGIDITTKQIMVRWYNENNVDKGGTYADICDARYNEEFVRFAWLLDFAVTQYPGAVVFAFQTIGANETKDSYVWKTGLGKLMITENVDNGAGGDEPTEDWFTNLMARIDEMYKAAEAANGMADQAKTAATEATEKALAAKKATDAATEATKGTNEATQAATEATEAADNATKRANEAADGANAAAQSVFTDKNFLLLRNEDGSLTLVFNEEPAAPAQA